MGNRIDCGQRQSRAIATRQKDNARGGADLTDGRLNGPRLGDTPYMAA